MCYMYLFDFQYFVSHETKNESKNESKNETQNESENESSKGIYKWLIVSG